MGCGGARTQCGTQMECILPRTPSTMGRRSVFNISLLKQTRDKQADESPKSSWRLVRRYATSSAVQAASADSHIADPARGRPMPSALHRVDRKGVSFTLYNAVAEIPAQA